MDFQKALQTLDTNFESILEIMKLRNEPEKVDSVRNLLVVVNLILEYFMNREEDELKIPVVYFPISQEYAQELCEDFVVVVISEILLCQVLVNWMRIDYCSFLWKRIPH